MDYKVNYRKENIIRTPLLHHIELDGEIGVRFDRFVYERVMGRVAIDEILREAEDCFRDKYDDEYAHRLWRCEFWGKLVLSAVRVCRMKDSEGLKEDIRRSVYKVLQYQEPSGYLGSYQDGDDILAADRESCIREVGWPSCYNWNVWGQKYTLWALLESAQLLEDQHILSCCERMADHLIGLIHGMGVRVKDTGVMRGMAACSILKPMLVLYRLTGKKEYYDFCLEIAKDWEREDGENPNLITNGLSGVSSANWYPLDGDYINGWHSKAYEMMSCFDGLIELYRVSGEERYLEAVKGFWDSTLRDEANILGSVGYCELFHHAKDYPDAATEICDVIHWMRLSHELFCLTGEVKYMEAFERAYLNAFLAGIYEDGRSGAFFVRSVGRHQTAEWQVETKYQHCCVNNVARGFVNAAESVVMESDEGYYINMYTPARVRFGGTTFRVGGKYVDNGTPVITVRGAEAGKKLFLRIPVWSKKTTITVVGEEVYETAQAGTYFALTLSGKDQVVRIAFDMTPEVIDFAGEFCADLPAEDYHIQRWCDSRGGLCDRTVMTKQPISVIRRGPVMLARSKRNGCSEEEMFGGETVFGKERSVAAQTIYHNTMLTLCRVTITCPDKEYHYVMCDYASAANRDLDDPRFFTMYV